MEQQKDKCDCNDADCPECGGKCEHDGQKMMHPTATGYRDGSRRHPWLCASCLAFWIDKGTHEVCMH